VHELIANGVEALNKMQVVIRYRATHGRCQYGLLSEGQSNFAQKLRTSKSRYQNKVKLLFYEKVPLENVE